MRAAWLVSLKLYLVLCEMTFRRSTVTELETDIVLYIYVRSFTTISLLVYLLAYLLAPYTVPNQSELFREGVCTYRT